MEFGVVAAWWACYQALLLAGLPLAAWLLPDAPHRGAGLALPVALVVLVVPTYWVGQVVFGPVAVLAGALALAGSVAVAARRTGFVFDRRAYAETAAVFTAGFLFVLAFRAVDAGAVPWGGEKFLDFGLLSSLLRADRLPPVDMWFSGERVVYYYGGHLVSATLAELTYTPARYAYNPALAGFFAAALTAVYGLAGAVADEAGFRRSTAAGLGAFLFGVASNLLVPAGLVGTYLWQPLMAHLAAATGTAAEHLRITEQAFGYWHSSRVIPGAITEFPFFAYLNGDLHAHMTSVPFTLLVAGCAYAYYRTPAAAVRRRRVLLYGVLPPVAGLLAVVNTWSLPAAVGVTWLAVAFADAPPRSLLSGARPTDPGPVRRAVASVALVAPVGMLALAWVVPFVANVLLAGAASRGVGFLAPQAPTGLVALLLAHGGFLLAFWWYLGGLARERGEHALLVGGAALTVLPALVGGLRLADVPGLGLGVVAAAPAVAVVGPLLVGAWYLHDRGRRAGWRRPGFEAVLLVAGAGLVLLVEFVYLSDPGSPGRYNTVFKVYAQVWALWTVAGGVALAGVLDRPAPERLRAAVGGRVPRLARPRTLAVGGLVAALSLYTVFSLAGHFEQYLRAWQPMLLPVAGVLGVLGATGLDRGGMEVPGVATVSAHPVLASVLVVLLGFHGALAATGGPAADSPPEPTIDALAFVQDARPGSAPAILWLNERPGQATIVEAPGYQRYAWTSPASSLTGHAAVVGWSTEMQYRSRAVYEARAADVDQLYTGSPAVRAAVLEKYDVEYVYVGPREREAYPDADLSFADEPRLAVAFSEGDVTIYEVVPGGESTDAAAGTANGENRTATGENRTADVPAEAPGVRTDLARTGAGSTGPGVSE